MKKVWSIILIATMCAICFCGCGKPTAIVTINGEEQTVTVEDVASNQIKYKDGVFKVTGKITGIYEDEFDSRYYIDIDDTWRIKDDPKDYVTGEGEQIGKIVDEIDVGDQITVYGTFLYVESGDMIRLLVTNIEK